MKNGKNMHNLRNVHLISLSFLKKFIKNLVGMAILIWLGYGKLEWKKLSNLERKKNYESYLKWARKFYLENNCNSREDFLDKTRKQGVPSEFTRSPATRYKIFRFNYGLITNNETSNRFAKLSLTDLKNLYEEYKNGATGVFQKNKLNGSKHLSNLFKQLTFLTNFQRTY